MKDKAIQGLSEANTKNRLANDAEVAKRNEKVGRRNDYKSGLSKVSTSSASPFFNSVKSNVSGSTNLTGANKNIEAKKRLNAVNKGLQTVVPAANAAANLIEQERLRNHNRSHNHNRNRNHNHRIHPTFLRRTEHEDILPQNMPRRRKRLPKPQPKPQPRTFFFLP